jgi:CpXC protein
MKISGMISVTCSLCGTVAEHEVVQSVNSREDPEGKERLMSGEFNVAQCVCGKRTQLASTVVFHDPDAGFLGHVCPDGEAAMQRAEAVFAASFAGAADATSTQRIVPSLNALIEKIKIVDAGLQDWAIEMTKVLLLASIEIDDDDRVLLFARVDRDAGVLRWLLFDPRGDHPAEMASPLAAYHRLVATSGGAPPPSHRRIDRAWAIEAVRQMISSGN